MSGFFLRIDEHDGYEAQIRMLSMTPDFEQFLAIKHTGEKTKENKHFHITVRSKIQMQAFRKRMKNVFTAGKGNGHMSIKVWDGGDDANAYMFHEPAFQIIANKGYSLDDIEKFKQRNAKVQIDVAKTKTKASWKIEELVLEKFLKGSLKHRHLWNQRGVAEEILRVSFETDKYQPNDFQLKLMADRILWKLCEGDEGAEKGVISSILNRIKWE